MEERGRQRKREGQRWMLWLWVSFPSIELVISLVTLDSGAVITAGADLLIASSFIYGQ